MNRVYVIVLTSFVVGFTLAVLLFRSHGNHADSRTTQALSSDEPAWCDATHKIPFVDAEHCGGLTSCDRAAFIHMANPYQPIRPVPCPK